MGASHDGGDGGGDAGPFGAEGGEAFVAAGGERVVIAAAAFDLAAVAADELGGGEVVEVGVDAALAEGQGVGGLDLDFLDELVAIHGAAGEEAQDEELGDAVQKTGIGFLHTRRTMPFSLRCVNIEL